jgi:hypothetical protein
VDHPLPWLRYVDADALDDQTIDFDGLKVRNDQMETLGEVDGFIVDSQSGRPYYVVVDSGGWFKSKDFLVPVGYARIDDDNDALVVDLPKERIHRFPGFDKDKFEKMSEADLKRFNDDICNACSTSVAAYSTTESYTAAWDRPEYRQPTWWNTEATLPDRMGDAAFAAGVEYPPAKVAPTAGMSDVDRGRRTEHITAHRTDATDIDVTAKSSGTRDDRATDESPYFDGRAQPGDVIGLETGGERTHVGETAEDENKRRSDAEEAAKKDRR